MICYTDERNAIILVTGGSGFIGSHTVRALHGLGEPSVVMQRRSGQVPPQLADLPVAAEQADVADLGALTGDRPAPRDHRHRAPRGLPRAAGHGRGHRGHPGLAEATGTEIVSLRISGTWGPLGHEDPFFAAPALIHPAASGKPP